MVKTLLVLSMLSIALGGYFQIFNDNFQNLNNWVAETLPGASTGNNEWEYYTSRPVNVYTTNNSLVLHAQAEKYQGYNYTSGKVHSSNTWGPYGFFNIKALVPKGNGLWPAIWMLPNGAQNIYGTWAACGEIDIMETVCSNSQAYSTLHFGGPWPANTQYPWPPANQYPFVIDWSQPHYFGVEWLENAMNFWFDASVVNGVIQGTKILSVPSSQWYSLNADGQKYPGNAPFNVPTNIVLNVAIGGDWPCSISGCCSNVTLPASMIVYNVQIWES